MATERVYIEAAHVYVERTVPALPYCDACGYDHDGACWTYDPFELDRPDLDFYDDDPSPYSGTYSEM